MSSLGDLVAGSTVDLKFTTSVAGTPAALSSGDIAVYKGNSTTPSTAGVTLTADFAGITGLNHVRIQTTGSTSFYVDGASYQVIISTGAVGSVSVKGYQVADFSLDHRRPTSTEVPASFETAVFSTAAWFASTSAPTNFSNLVVSTSGIADANVQQWRGTQPSTYRDWLDSTDAPASFAGAVFSTAAWLPSTGAPTNFANLAITTGGIVDADVETWRGTQPSTYRDWLDSTDAPTNFELMSLTTAGRVSVGSFGSTAGTDIRDNAGLAMSSVSRAWPSSAPSSTGATYGEMLSWVGGLSLAQIRQDSTEQKLYAANSTTTVIARAPINATTSEFLKSAWT